MGSIIWWGLAKYLGWKIEKAVNEDKELQKSIKEADEDLDKARVIIDDLIDMGLTVPPFMKKYASKRNQDNKK